MLVGVIAFDLSVNVIDRWRMNKIQQRALEAEKIEQKLQEARLELALHQIKPHFLQNALMSIKVLCRTRPKEAEQAVYDFAVFLRGNMNALESAEMILFREECKTIERYLHIEKMRFGERLQVQWDLQEEKFQIPFHETGEVFDRMYRTFRTGSEVLHAFHFSDPSVSGSADSPDHQGKSAWQIKCRADRTLSGDPAGSGRTFQ